MRVRYTSILAPQLTDLMKERFALPEPPTDQEMAEELAGLDKLAETLQAMKAIA